MKLTSRTHLNSYMKKMRRIGGLTKCRDASVIDWIGHNRKHFLYRAFKGDLAVSSPQAFCEGF